MKRRIVSILICVVAGSACFLLGFASGQAKVVNASLLTNEGSVDIEKVVQLYSKTRRPEISFDQYWDVWDMVQEKYVDEDIDDVSLFYSSVAGMVAGLGDPYSVYLPPKETESFISDLNGEFEGIGAEIGIRDELLTVIAPLPESPAEQAGLRPGDQIIRIDGEDAIGLTVETAVVRIRGEKGTSVTLTIARDGEQGLIDISIIRDTITVPTVVYELDKNTNIAYVRVSQFNQDTWSQFDEAVSEIVINNPAGIILDLRSNPGGFLDTSVQVASEWIPEGSIVIQEERNKEPIVFSTVGPHRLAGFPTVVLVNEGSASGSEIVAGALQDHGVAQVVGAQTFGKGSVQDFEILPDGSALKITVAEWLTPNGRHINTVGITPDSVVDPMFSIDTDSVVDYGREHAVALLLKDE
jgi:carboxyl-terminal processing protease